MKKLIIIAMILALLLPAAAGMEDEEDPIVGCWYAAVNQKNLEENARIRGVSIEVRILYFDPTGVIKSGVIAFGNSTGLNDIRSTPVAGTWVKKEDGKYGTVYENIIGESILEDGVLYIPYDEKEKLAYRRIYEVSLADVRK